MQVEQVENMDNVIQLKAPEKNMGTVMNKQGKLVQSVYDLQSDLIAGE